MREQKRMSWLQTTKKKRIANSRRSIMSKKNKVEKVLKKTERKVDMNSFVC